MARCMLLSVLLLLWCEQSTAGAGECPILDEDWGATNGGWERPHAESTLDTATCTIERRHIETLSPEEFLQRYWENTPVIVEGYRHNAEALFAKMCAKDVLLWHYGAQDIVLSTANKNSYEKKTVPLTRYLDEFMVSPPVTQLGNTTWYHFGNNNHKDWPELFAAYRKPEEYMEDPTHFAYSFGLGASGTGVPFHTHGGVFNEVMYGRKRWWLAPPGPEPAFHPDESALQWTYTYYGNESAHNVALQECVIGAGEFIYVPGRWHHSTLNIGDTVFMATFL